MSEARDVNSSTKRIVIDVWSDIMCPFCYIGDTILAQALDQFVHKDSVDIVFHSYLLMPDLPVGTSMTLTELLVTKRGFPKAQALEMNNQTAARGKEVGLDFRMEKAIATNTRKAHELIHFAKNNGHEHEMVRRLFKAYFEEGMNVGDLDELAGLAADVGLDSAEAKRALESGRNVDLVDADLAHAQKLGINGVPFFVFNNKYALSGAQPIETFSAALARTWDDS